MANEQYSDKFDEHEEGEYHFSDDQTNYEMEPDSKGPVAAAAPLSANLAEKLTRHRRTLLGVVVFLVLLAIVYKLVSPSTSTPATDFNQQTMTSSVVPEKKMPAVSATPPVVVSTPVQPTLPAPAAPPQPQAMPMQPPAGAATSSANAPATVAQPPVVPEQNKNVLERVTTLEQQNTAIMNLLQTQYAQKMADNDAQTNQLRTELQEVNARIANMEVAFQQLTKILRQMRNPTAGGTSNAAASSDAANAPAVKIIQPKMSYTVQAIIPGRAWLKSEAGDTVTVAEGDMLKDFGRVTKIDPYDGIVDIDTGNKVITLSYGTSGD